MNYEHFNNALNQIALAESPSEVEDWVAGLHRLTDHGDSADRIKAEEAIMKARKRAWERGGGANSTQVGGGHYSSQIQHWDYVVANDLGYFEGQITKYVTRWRKKNGLEDLKKAQHFLNKLIEVEEIKNGR